MPRDPSARLVSDQVFMSLLDAVLSGAYAAGERLPRQRELAADLGVTLGSLREALKRLEQMGLVDVRHGDATRVNDWREHGGVDLLVHLLLRGGTLDAGVLDAVLEARALTLRELAGLAAARRTDAQAERLRELAGRLADVADPVEAAHLDFAFFSEVADAAANIVFVLLLNAIRRPYFAQLHAMPVTGDPRALAPAYTQIATAVGDGDADAARTAAFDLATLQQRIVVALIGDAR